MRRVTTCVTAWEKLIVARKPQLIALVLVAATAPAASAQPAPSSDTPPPPPQIITNPFVTPSETVPAKPQAAGATTPAAVGVRYPAGPQPIENPYYQPSNNERPWQKPTVANPFSQPDSSWTLIRPLHWGPSNRWRIVEPPPKKIVENDGPKLRTLEDVPQLEPISAPGELKLPEAMEAVGTEDEPPDPIDWTNTTVAQPTWLDVLTDDVRSTDAGVVPAETQVAEQSNGTPDGDWQQPDKRNYDATYDPFEESAASPVRLPKPTATAATSDRDAAADADDWRSSVPALIPPKPDAAQTRPVERSELVYIAEQATVLPEGPSLGDPSRGSESQPIDGSGDNAGPIALDMDPLPEDADSLLTEVRAKAVIAESRDQLSEVIRLARYVLTKDVDANQIRSARQLAAWAHNRRGELLEEAGDGDAALNDFHAAVTLDGSCWLALHNRAICMAERHEYDHALRDFAAALEQHPGLTVAYRNRAELLSSLGRSQEASEDYTMAIQQQPTSADLYVARGHTWHRLQEYKRAINDFTRAIQLDPSKPQAYTGRGNLLAEVGLYEQALANFDLALRADATCVAAHRSRAWLLATCPDATCRDAEKSLAAARQAARFAPPNDPFVLEALAAASAAAGQFNDAVQFQQRALAVASDEAAGPLRYRLALYQQQRPFVSGRPDGVQAASFAE